MEGQNSMYLIEAQEAYKKFLKSARGIFGFNFRKKENLKSFSEVQKEENAYNSINLGIKEVPMDRIVGSVEKYKDFDRNFVPQSDVVRQRWINIYIGYMADSMLPPVILYKLKENYYVYDGNHRVSVAKFLNFATIEAEVEEFLPTKDTKEEIIYREHMFFEKETGIGDIMLTEPIKYRYLKEEIENYSLLLADGDNVGTDLKKVAGKWYKNVFLPIKGLLEDSGIIGNFQGSSINDLFLFVLDHKYFLSKNEGENKGYLFSVIDFINYVKTNEDKSLNNRFKAIKRESVEKCEKLAKVDTELNPYFSGEEKERETLKDLLWNIFLYRISQLSNKYKGYVDDFRQGSQAFPDYIMEYMEARNQKKILTGVSRGVKDGKFEDLKEDELKDIEIYVMEYIISVFLPVIEIFERVDRDALSGIDKFFANEYRKLQNEFLFLIGMEEILEAEGKPIKYEDIMKERINAASILGNMKNLYGTESKLAQEKQKEFLRNLKNPERFLNILEKYGGIKKYRTYATFFIMLDNYGEKGFMEKLERDMEELYELNDIISSYKTEETMDMLATFIKYGVIDDNEGKMELTETEYSFMDFYVMKGLEGV